MKYIVFVIVIPLLAVTMWVYVLVKKGRKDKANLGRRGTSTPQLSDEIMLWAFGEDWNRIELHDLPDRWNELHGDLFLSHVFDDIEETDEKIRKAWKASREQETDQL